MMLYLLPFLAVVDLLICLYVAVQLAVGNRMLRNLGDIATGWHCWVSRAKVRHV
jgi:hypothetical protein